jgi:myo-inositol-1(or 4)-monophosphatase
MTTPDLEGATMPDQQLLHLVIGGELADVEDVRFRDLSKIHFVGAYPTYREALAAWRGASQSTVDNALVRYFIIHAHKLLDPHDDGH